MGFIDDIKAKIDQDGNGMSFDDLKSLAEQYGLGDQVAGLEDQLKGPDGNVSLDDAQRILGDLGGNLGDTLSDIKDKLFGGK